MQNSLDIGLDYNGNIKLRLFKVGGNIVPQVQYKGLDRRTARYIKQNIERLCQIETKDEFVNIFIGKEKFASLVTEPAGLRQNPEFKPRLLTTFETALLARREPGIELPFSRDINPLYAPRIDVHAHFASCLTAEQLIEIGLKHNIEVAPYFQERLGVNPDNLARDKNGNIKLADLVKDQKYNALIGSLELPADRQESFNKLEEIYRMRNLFSKNDKLFPDILCKIAEDMSAQGIKYTQLSLSPIINDINCLKAIHRLVPDIEKKTGCKIRFLAALWRHSDREWIGDEIDRIKAISKSPYVVGVDFMGHETNSTKVFADDIKDIAKWAMLNDPSFVIRVHAGENPIFPDNVKDTLKAIKEVHHQTEIEAGQKLKLPNVRIGHGIYGIDSETIVLLKETKAVVEFNMSSNFMLNNIDDLNSLPFKIYSENKIPFVICTDGRGVYNTSYEQELILAHAGGMTPDDFLRKLIIENKIMTNDETSFAKKMSKLNQKLKNMSFEDALKCKFSTADGMPRFNTEVEKRYLNRKKDLLDFLHNRFDEFDIKTGADAIKAATYGKFPILFTGASEANWAKIAPDDREEIKLTLQTLLNVLDADKVYFITRGSNSGVEKEFYNANKRHGLRSANPHTVLGLVTDEAFYWDESKIAGKTITHADVLTVNNRLAKNWLELSDAVLWNLAKEKGEIVAIGGVSLVRDIVQRGHNMGIEMNLMSGPYGASTDRLNIFRGHDYGFKGAQGLINKLYQKHPDIFNDDFEISRLDRYTSQAKEQIGSSVLISNLVGSLLNR